MNIAYFCIFLAAIMPMCLAGVAKYLGGFKAGHNHKPRAFLEKLEGKAFFAKSAHDNSWEAFGPFAAAVIISLQAGVDSTLVDQLAMSFIGLRILYSLCYIFDKPLARTTVFMLSWACLFTLFYKAWSV